MLTELMINELNNGLPNNLHQYATNVYCKIMADKRKIPLKLSLPISRKVIEIAKFQCDEAKFVNCLLEWLDKNYNIQEIIIRAKDVGDQVDIEAEYWVYLSEEFNKYLCSKYPIRNFKLITGV